MPVRVPPPVPGITHDNHQKSVSYKTTALINLRFAFQLFSAKFSSFQLKSRHKFDIFLSSLISNIQIRSLLPYKDSTKRGPQGLKSRLKDDSLFFERKGNDHDIKGMSRITAVRTFKLKYLLNCLNQI